MNREQGTVKVFNAAKGYGFIRRDSGDDLFFHVSAIQSLPRFVTEGHAVEFTVGRGAKGPRAENITKIETE